MYLPYAVLKVQKITKILKRNENQLIITAGFFSIEACQEVNMKVLYGETQDRNIIKEECRHGKRIAEVILGANFLIHRYFFKTSYIAYHNSIRIYMRVAGGEFGEFPIDEYSLIVVDKKGKEHALHVDRPEYIRKILKWIENNQKEIQIGKEQEK